MARVSMGDVWDDTKAFVAREAGLLFPLALATVGIAALIWGLAAPAPDAQGRVVPGGWMIVLVPVFLLLLLGALSISALVLRPGGSVGEALRVGAGRLGAALGAFLLLGVAATLAIVLASLVGAVAGAVSGGGEGAAAQISLLLVLPPFVWLAVRCTVLMPVLVAEPALGIAAALRRAFALTRGHAAVILGVAVIYAVSAGLISSALQYGLGTILLLIARAAGMPALGLTLTGVVLAAVVAVLQAVSLVFQVMLFRRLAALRRA